jgi:AcrR family transcriptional regulator
MIAPLTAKEAKRLLLLDAALVCFTTQGFQTTTAQIAQWAGVASGSLFTHFATKEDLIHATAAHAQDLLCQGIVNGPGFPRDTVYDGLRRVWQALTHQAIRYPRAWQYHLRYVATYNTPDPLLQPRLRVWQGVGQLLVRTAKLSRQQAEWSAVLLETQWFKAMQLLVGSEAVDSTAPWGGVMSAYAFHSWWAGIGLSKTHPMSA